MGAETSKADAMDDSSVHAALSQRSSSEKEKLREISRQDKIVRNRVRGGVHYNMKIILCGERGSGKTALFKRFQGLSFVASVRVVLATAPDVVASLEDLLGKPSSFSF